MSPDVAAFLLDLLLRQHIPVNDPQLVSLAALAARARAELEDAVAAGAQPTEKS